MGKSFSIILLVLLQDSNGFISQFPSKSLRPTIRFATPVSASDMRVKEIKAELVDLGIDFSDCFDKESLAIRLEQARSGAVLPTPEKDEDVETEPKDDDSKEEPVSEVVTSIGLSREDTLIELRALRVKELRAELADRGLRWAGLLEKEDLVQAVLKARLDAANFSSTGLITPGKVAQLTGPQLTEEISFADSPLLVDVYATWCGPCQLMAPILEQVASDMKGIRFVKMDSDANPSESSTLKVQGLPTLLLFRNGEEIDRVEGALMKDQLKEWISSHNL